MMVRVHRLVSGVNILSDKIAYLIFTLSEDTTSSTNQVIGRAVFVTCTTRLVLFMCLKNGTIIVVIIILLCVPCIPFRWVVHPVGQHVARIVAHVVG